MQDRLWNHVKVAGSIQTIIVWGSTLTSRWARKVRSQIYLMSGCARQTWMKPRSTCFSATCSWTMRKEPHRCCQIFLSSCLASISSPCPCFERWFSITLDKLTNRRPSWKNSNKQIQKLSKACLVKKARKKLLTHLNCFLAQIDFASSSKLCYYRSPPKDSERIWI